MNTIKATEFVERMRRHEDMVIVDVRTDIEWNAEHLKGTVIHMPLHTLRDESASRLIQIAKGKPIYILCRSGGRAMKAYEFLAARGVPNLYIIQGGIEDCKACDAETQCGKTMSLERQVRIAAGIMILAGFLAGIAGWPWAHTISAFVGAGLVFAGVTNKCGMALILARAPWNRDPMAAARQSMGRFDHSNQA